MKNFLTTTEHKLSLQFVKFIFTECIGYYGKDCSDPCPTGLYGKRCAESCDCSVNETCDQFVGCMPKPAFGKYGKTTY